MMMNPEVRAGLSDALAQLVAWLTYDHEGAKSLHTLAAQEERTWPLNRALLFLAERGWREYFRATDRTDVDLVTALRADIANLATMPEDSV